MTAKREIALAGLEVCDLAMEVAGGRACLKGSVIERCYRDIRAAKFHTFTPELTLLHAGRAALGLPADRLDLAPGRMRATYLSTWNAFERPGPYRYTRKSSSKLTARS